MFPKTTRRAKDTVLIGILCIPILAGGIYLYYQNTGETVQERIYVVPERSESPKVQPDPAFQPADAHTVPASAAAVSYDEDFSTADDHDYEPDTSSDGGDVFLTEISEGPVLSEIAFDAAAAEEARIAGIASQIEKLGIALNEKYPEIAQLATVSPAELEELYPTSEDRQELAELGQKVLAEFTGEIRSLFLQLPANVQEDSFDEVREHFTTYMGQEMADAIMKELRSRMGE